MKKWRNGKLVNKSIIRWQSPEGPIKISRIGTNSRTFTGPNLRRPRTLYRYFFPTPLSWYPSPPQILKPTTNLPPLLPSPSQFHGAIVIVAFPPRPAFVAVASSTDRRLVCSHGRLRRSRIRQCPRRRRVVLLLLRPARHPQERLLHGHTLRLPKARHGTRSSRPLFLKGVSFHRF